MFRQAQMSPPPSSPGSPKDTDVCAFCGFEYGEKDDPWLDEPWLECLQCELFCHSICMKHHKSECKVLLTSGVTVLPISPSTEVSNETDGNDLMIQDNKLEDDDDDENKGNNSIKKHDANPRSQETAGVASILRKPLTFSHAENDTKKAGELNKSSGSGLKVTSGAFGPDSSSMRTSSHTNETARLSNMVTSTPIPTPTRVTPERGAKNKAVATLPSTAPRSTRRSPRSAGLTGKGTSSSNNVTPAKRKRLNVEGDVEFTTPTGVENADEHCCFLALADSFRNLGNRGKLIAKQEALRVLCNVVYDLTTPSMLLPNLEPSLPDGKGEENGKKIDFIFYVLN